jgi:hypothetical protein
MTERTSATRAPRRPGPAPVIWGSLALFAVLFTLLAHQLSTGQAAGSQPVVERKVVKKRVVTTVIPEPGPETSTEVAPEEESLPEEAAPVATGAS